MGKTGMARFKELIKPYFLKDGETNTHFLMDNGKLCVNDEEKFHDLYAQYIEQGGNAYVVALKTPIFKLFFDFDIHLLDHPDQSLSVKIAKYVLSTIKELFLDLGDCSLIICGAETKNTKKNGIECIKYGLHFHIPTLHVSVQTALKVRIAVIQKLSNNMGEKPCLNGPTTWEEDVDTAVFEKNGLRMPYSRKMTNCHGCKAKRGGCELCLFNGKIDEGREYKPTYMIKSDFSLHDISNTTIREVIELTSIRSKDTVESHTLNP